MVNIILGKIISGFNSTERGGGGGGVEHFFLPAFENFTYLHIAKPQLYIYSYGWIDSERDLLYPSLLLEADHLTF